MKMKKKISIIIPTFNRYDMLRQAVESIKNQTYLSKEIIVIDDCSSDKTHDIEKVYPEVIYIKNEQNKGPSYNRKKGLEIATGDYIVFMDDDDYYTDNYFFEKAIDIFASEEKLVFVSANSTIKYEDTGKMDKHILSVRGKCLSRMYLRNTPFEDNMPTSTFPTIFSKTALDKADFGNMEMVNDMAIYMRSMLGEKNIYMLTDDVGVYRIHKTNISNNIDVEFLINNLKEKLYVYQYIKRKKLFPDYDEWWIKQIQVSVGYWVYGSHPKDSDFQRMYHWCLKNSEDTKCIKKTFSEYRVYLKDLRRCKWKNAIKCFFKYKVQK